MEQSPSTIAYRGKLLGLMAVHLVLLGINGLLPGLSGKVVIYFDCNSELKKVECLPLLWIPSQFKHADILNKNPVDCTSLTFAVEFMHSAPTRMIGWTSAFSLGQPISTVQ